MPGFLGLDPVWVKQKSGRLNALGAEIDAILKGVERVRNDSANPKLWSGPDQQRFANWYDTEGRIALQQAAGILRSLGRNFQTNADGQMQVSR